MTKRERIRLQEIFEKTRFNQLDLYISKLKPGETSFCISVIYKWLTESQAKHNQAWHKAKDPKLRKLIEEAEMGEIKIIADILFTFSKKKFLEHQERKQRLRKKIIKRP